MYIVRISLFIITYYFIKAGLFNDLFYRQFDSSEYNISVDGSDPKNSQIDFSISRVFDILKSLNFDKAMGPDKIHGCILKFC